MAQKAFEVPSLVAALLTSAMLDLGLPPDTTGVVVTAPNRSAPPIQR